MGQVRTEIYIFEDAKNKNISFDINSSKKQGSNLIFTLSLLRIYGNDFKERLNIQILDGQGNYNGEIDCSPLSIEGDLYQLKEYGTALSRSDIMKLDKIIDSMYRDIDRDKDNSVIDADAERDLLDILKLICKFINDNGDKYEAVEINGEKLYNIPVMEFRNIFRNTVYMNCGYMKIKKALRNNDITVCAAGRNDNTVKIDEKNVKVISIKADEPDVIDCLEATK